MTRCKNFRVCDSEAESGFDGMCSPCWMDTSLFDDTEPKMTLVGHAIAFCTALNTRADKLAADGRRPLYRNFGFDLGRKRARIFSDTGQRSARVFVDAEGIVRRADSWKRPGRTLGARDLDAVIAYVLGSG